MKSTKLHVLSLAVTAALAPMAHAQFGSGIVFDPTQSAHAIQQITQASQLYTTAVATRNQVVTMYNLAFQMAQLPQNLGLIGRSGPVCRQRRTPTATLPRW